MTDHDVEEAVDAVMEEIRDNDCLSSDVPKAISVAFLKSIIKKCRDDLTALESDDAEPEADSDEE